MTAQRRWQRCGGRPIHRAPPFNAHIEFGQTWLRLNRPIHRAPSFNAYTGLWLDDEPQYSSDFYAQTGSDPAEGTLIQDILFPPSLNQDDTDDGLYDIGSIDAGGQDTGIAITGLDTTDGTWQVSVDNGGSDFDGTDWQPISNVSDTNALLLDEADYIRFVPNAGYFGDITDAVTFRLWDETSGTAMTYADVSDNGGTTAYSADTATAAIRIDPLVSVTGSGGEYTISTTSAVPWNLEVSGQVDSVGDGSLLFTATIPADQSSVTVDFSTLTSIAIAATGLVGVSLDGPPAGYDYYLDPAASSVAITGTPDGNTGIEEAAVDSECQDGDTLAVTLDNSGATTAMSWYTVDGTAIAGQDYQSASGSVPAGQTETVDITLDNLDAPGGSAFFIHTTFVDSLGQMQNVYNPVTIQTAGLQLEADSNNDGRIDAEDDAAANTADVGSSSGGAFVAPNTRDTSGLTGQQLIAAGQLIEVALDFNPTQGTSITLSAQGDTGDFTVWTSPDRGTPIAVTGGGTTWQSDAAPDTVWIMSSAPGEITLAAQVSVPGAASPPPQKIVVNSSILRLAPAEPGQAGIPSGSNGQVNVAAVPNTDVKSPVDVRFYQAQATGDTMPEVSSLNDLAARLANYDNGSIKVLTVMGHGAGTLGGVVLDWGAGDPGTFTAQGVNGTAGFAQLLREKLAPGAVVVLYGCTSGGDSDVTNVEALAAALGCPVYASTGNLIDTSDGHLYYAEGQWRCFTATGFTAVNPNTNPQLFGEPEPAPPSVWQWLFNPQVDPLSQQPYNLD